MTTKIGEMVVMNSGGLSVSTFTGPGGQFAIQLTPSSAQVSYLQLKPDQVLELIQLLHQALHSGRAEKWDLKAKLHVDCDCMDCRPWTT